jgi:hypothetical protein
LLWKRGMNKKLVRKLSITTHTVRVLRADHLRDAAGGYRPPPSGGTCSGGGDMLPYSNAYPTLCLGGTACGGMSSACA